MQTMTSFQPVEIIQGNFQNALLLVADHAMRHLPDEYGRLGLPDAEFDRHIAYDIGVEGVTRHLSALTGAPAVMARYSRLLIDPNRGEDDPTLVRQIYDGSVIQANYPLSAEERARRVEQYYRPFRDAVSEYAAQCEAASGSACFIISIHSFTPVMGAKPRPWHIGLLWDKDDRAAKRLDNLLRREPGLIIGDNEPYDGALKGDTMHEEGTKHGRAHILIEIRQDLIETETGQREWAERLAPLLTEINLDPDMHTFRQFGSRTD
ncbi:MAG: N-formylglutamate amidohydrolase [Rhizobiaceae bacterium]